MHFVLFHLVLLFSSNACYHGTACLFVLLLCDGLHHLCFLSRLYMKASRRQEQLLAYMDSQEDFGMRAKNFRPK